MKDILKGNKDVSLQELTFSWFEIRTCFELMSPSSTEWRLLMCTSLLFVSSLSSSSTSQTTVMRRTSIVHRRTTSGMCITHSILRMLCTCSTDWRADMLRESWRMMNPLRSGRTSLTWSKRAVGSAVSLWSDLLGGKGWAISMLKSSYKFTKKQRRPWGWGSEENLDVVEDEMP